MRPQVRVLEREIERVRWTRADRMILAALRNTCCRGRNAEGHWHRTTLEEPPGHGDATWAGSGPYVRGGRGPWQPNWQPTCRTLATV